MKNKHALVILTGMALTGIVLGTVMGAWANHRWGCYRYPDGAIGVWVPEGNDYTNIFMEEIFWDADSWGSSTHLALTRIPDWKMFDLDTVNAYWGTFGETGWLGLAIIYLYSDGCTISVGQALLNLTYLDNGNYSRTNKKHVACQEVGHLFGLDHNRQASDTCMNDTLLTAPQPNAHDRDLINSIY